MINKKEKKNNRYNNLIIIMIVIFVTITLRLCHIQIYKYDYYKELSNTRSIRKIPNAAPRGMILDSTGSVLAKSESATYKENGVQEKVGRTSYATYVGFAPANNPEIAVAVIIYDGGHGGWAAPVARAIYEEYFRERLVNKNYKFKTNYKLK